MSSPLGPNAIEGEGGQLINNESLVTSPPDVPTTGAEGPASLSVVDTNLGSQRLQTPLNCEELVEPDVARRLTPEKLSHSQCGDTKSAIELEDNTSTPTTNSADLSLFAGGDELNYRSDDTPCLLGQISLHSRQSIKSVKPADEKPVNTASKISGNKAKKYGNTASFEAVKKAGKTAKKYGKTAKKRRKNRENLRKYREFKSGG